MKGCGASKLTNRVTVSKCQHEAQLSLGALITSSTSRGRCAPQRSVLHSLNNYPEYKFVLSEKNAP
jgi:hypothetical protein